MSNAPRIACAAALGILLSACSAGPHRYTQPGADAGESEAAVIRGYSRNYLVAADDMAFDLTAVADNTLVAYLNEARVMPGRYCVQARRWTMLLRASDMTMSDRACFDAEGGHSYVIRRRDDGFSVIDRQNATVVSTAATETS